MTLVQDHLFHFISLQKKIDLSDFDVIHSASSYRSHCRYFYQVLQLLPKEQSSKILKTFLKTEERYHGEDRHGFHLCIKTFFGSTKETLLSQFKEKPSRNIFKKIFSPKMFFRMKFLFTVCWKIIFYFIDLFKDIFLLITFSNYFNFHEDGFFKTSSFAIFTTLTISVVSPIVLNAFMVLYNYGTLIRSRLGRVLVIPFIPFFPAIAVYMVEKLALIKAEIVEDHLKQRKRPWHQTVRTLVPTL